MHIPVQIKGLRPLTILLTLAFFLWIPLEGNLWQTVLLAVLSTAVGLLSLLQKQWGGQTVSKRKWGVITAVLGFLFGGGSNLLTLCAMALKTGLHAHGPEFTPADIQWLLAQFPLWLTAGTLAGFALGLITHHS